MGRIKIRNNAIYEHFKGNKYVVMGVGKHTETDECMVIYYELNNENNIYVRPLDMFLSKVDKEKYPDSKKEYRFTFIGFKGDKIY